jgi:hypothetical protein
MPAQIADDGVELVELSKQHAAGELAKAASLTLHEHQRGQISLTMLTIVQKSLSASFSNTSSMKIIVCVTSPAC